VVRSSLLDWWVKDQHEMLGSLLTEVKSNHLCLQSRRSKTWGYQLGSSGKSRKYNFLLTGIEGTGANGKTRVKITDPANNNAVIYDIQPSAAGYS
jgi:hypothetical protein